MDIVSETANVESHMAPEDGFDRLYGLFSVHDACDSPSLPLLSG